MHVRGEDRWRRLRYLLLPHNSVFTYKHIKVKIQYVFCFTPHLHTISEKDTLKHTQPTVSACTMELIQLAQIAHDQSLCLIL